MQFRNVQFQSTIAASGFLFLAAAAMAQQPAEPTVIRTETKMVLVDVVVTGKKGVYVDDLEMKNFRVWEDNKEQQVKSFSTGSDPNSPFGQKRYIVLFFDNSTMSIAEQAQARSSPRRTRRSPRVHRRAASARARRRAP